MRKLLIRHGLSEANNHENIGTPAYGSKDAELMELGIDQAREIPSVLLSRYAISSCNSPVATSTLRRTQQTAAEAGFHYQKAYSQLDEIERQSLEVSGIELKKLLANDILLPKALSNARNTLDSMPSEEIVFTHGLLIASICRVLGQHQDERMIPYFCEIREINI